MPTNELYDTDKQNMLVLAFFVIEYRPTVIIFVLLTPTTLGDIFIERIEIWARW